MISIPYKRIGYRKTRAFESFLYVAKPDARGNFIEIGTGIETANGMTCHHTPTEKFHYTYAQERAANLVYHGISLNSGRYPELFWGHVEVIFNGMGSPQPHPQSGDKWYLLELAGAIEAILKDGWRAEERHKQEAIGQGAVKRWYRVDPLRNRKSVLE